MYSYQYMWDLVFDDESLLLAGFKKCTTCEKYLPVANFRRKSRSTEALHYICRKCSKAYHEKVRHKYRESKNENGRKARAELRMDVLSHYSGNIFPECACCHEYRLEFLALDHIDGGGNKHKQEVRHIYKWTKQNNYPPMFRVLCHNCNQSLGAYGYCPHQKEAGTQAGTESRATYRQSN